VKDEIKQSVYLERLKDTISTQKDLAIKLGISESMVSRAMKSMMGTHDYQLRQLLAGKFLEEFQMASDYWKMQIKLLEDLKKNQTMKP
jgi:transcriptional regulator with XRE-family HTH domain